MNSNTKLMLGFFILSVVAVVGIMFYLVYDITMAPDNNDTTTEETTIHQLTASDDTTDVSDTDNSTYVQASAEYSEDTHKYIFVGDSRYVAMEEYKTENDTFICDNGVGRYYLIENMTSIISLAEEENARIVIGLGVNDIVCPDEYITLLKELRSKTDAEIFYVLVNPVDEELCGYSGYSITNQTIDSFNQQVSDGIADEDIYVIDVNSFLKSAGYSCTDGLHYTDETYSTIFHYLKTCLSNY